MTMQLEVIISFFISLAFLLSYIASFVANNVVQKHFDFPHENSKISFMLNFNGKNNKLLEISYFVSNSNNSAEIITITNAASKTRL